MPPVDGGEEERAATATLLTVNLMIPKDKVSDQHEKRLKHCMRRLGWDGPSKMRISGKWQRGYRRQFGARDIPAPLTGSLLARVSSREEDVPCSERSRSGRD